VPRPLPALIGMIAVVILRFDDLLGPTAPRYSPF